MNKLLIKTVERPEKIYSTGAAKLAAQGLAIMLVITLGSCISPTLRAPEIDNALLEAEEARQAEIALDALIADFSTIYDRGYPLLFAGAAICGEQVRPDVGWLVSHKGGLPDELQKAGMDKYGFDERLQIVHLPVGTPAGRSGLKVGDKLLEINAVPVPRGDLAYDQFDQFTARQFSASSASVLIERAGQQINVVLYPQQACDYQLRLTPHDAVNAFADGQNIAITRGMLRFATSEELSVVLAHELAHNAMAHIKAKQRNAVLGFLLDIFAMSQGVNSRGAFSMAGANAYSQEYEAEADYLGLYFMARAGEPLESAPAFWRRMAALNPGGIQRSQVSTHPATAQRFVAMEAAVAEIKAKQAAGQLLFPNPK